MAIIQDFNICNCFVTFLVQVRALCLEKHWDNP
jgi:hypothetical protein